MSAAQRWAAREAGQRELWEVQEVWPKASLSRPSAYGSRSYESLSWTERNAIWMAVTDGMESDASVCRHFNITYSAFRRVMRDGGPDAP